MYRSTGARSSHRGALLLITIGIAATLTAGAVAVVQAGGPAAATDPFAGMPDPEAVDARQAQPQAQVGYSVGAPRVRIHGHRRLYRIDSTGQIQKVRLVNFGLSVYRAAEKLANFDGRSFIQITSGRWSGWYVKALATSPNLVDRYSSASVELSAGKHSGVRFYADGHVRVRRPIYLDSATTFEVGRRATLDGRDYYLVKQGPLAGRWIHAAQGATLIATGAREPGTGDAPEPTSQPNPTTEPQPTQQPVASAAPQPTAAPAATWKGIVLIYPGTDVTYTRADGTDYHLTSQMSGTMRDLVLNTVQRFSRSVNNWSGGNVAMDLDIVEVPHNVTALDRLGDGYWLGPRSVRDDLDHYAPDGTYDSIFVVWKARDDKERIPVGGWGLTLPPGSWANGAGYSSIITPSEMWWWTDSTNPEEVFVHEWMHQVLYWQEQHERLSLDLHGGASYGYESVNGTWKRWLSDLMKGEVRDGNHYTGVDRAMWAADQPTRP